MKCPECKQRLRTNDVRVVAFHISEAHKVPFSVLINILHRMGFTEEQTAQFHKYPILNPKLHAKEGNGTEQLTRLFGGKT